MWLKRQPKNRRAGRTQNVLDVKVRSNQLRAGRMRLAVVALGVSIGTLLGVYGVWQLGQWALNRFVYQNDSFAIRQVDIQTDGIISTDQLRRWSGVRNGDNLIALDLARVKRDLELVPMIQAAAVERILPATLRIRVTEREPVAQVTVPRPRTDGGFEWIIFQLDADGYVMLPLDPRQRAVQSNEADEPLPTISGINFSELQSGRRLESPQVQAALKLIVAFDGSPMAGVVDLKSVDVSASEVLTATTGQRSEVTFLKQNLDQQLLHWWSIHQECVRQGRTIGTLDLAVGDHPVLRPQEETVLPPSPPRTAKPSRTRKRNV
jgi:hypothetical protein